VIITSHNLQTVQTQ